ncbi:MAG: Release factor glutamine methyltransferase [Candidatus Heimdallarchaeota archaeon LC_3]|nr:MAG: Release factor glutamine methyltransferase [Candidatus Heimdallarchaeota archaeon LC_3]
MIKLEFIEVNAKNYSLRIEEAIKKCPDLKKYVDSITNKFDLGNSEALINYNQCLFRVLDGLDIEIPPEHLIPTAGLRRCIVDILYKEINPRSIIEIGTGSTAIIAQLFALRGITAYATEIDQNSVESANKNIKNNLNMFSKCTIFKSDGGILDWLIEQEKGIFPVDLVLSLPPYYLHGSPLKSMNRGFLGTKNELFSYAEAEDFSIQLFNEWINHKDILPNIAILWKSQDSLFMGLDRLRYDFSESKLYRITSGTRKRILSIHN